MKYLSTPQFKVTITHDAEDIDYINDLFPSVRVKRRENNYDTATLELTDLFWQHYGIDINKLNEIKIYFKDATESNYTQVFGGYMRKILPRISSTGLIHQLLCKGYGAALEATHCNRDYGVESANPSYPQPWNIWKNVIADFVEKSFAGDASGWEIDNTYITDNYGTDIPFINNPYRKNIDIVNLVCDLTSAMGAGLTAGAHWIVDHNKTGAGKPRFLVAKIGDHAAGATSPETYWPDWWSTDEAGSTITQGHDFFDYVINDSTEEFANKVILITDLRKPPFDYWCENHAELWGSDNIIALTADAGTKIVGTHSIKIESKTSDFGDAYLSAGVNPWDFTKWGSSKTIPRFNYYTNSNSAFTGELRMYTTDFETDYYTMDPWSLFSDPTGEWVHHSIPIGPYWANTTDTQKQNWTIGDGGPDWESIAGFDFHVDGIGSNGIIYVDDAYFSGKIMRSAYDSANITANKEFQKTFISQVTLDDSAVADDVTGLAARLAAAELFRRESLPYTVSLNLVGLVPSMKGGQKIHVHAGKKLDNSYAVNVSMRVIELEHILTMQGGYTEVTATTDLLNSHPINSLDQYAAWKENMLVNSKEAKDIRAGSEVDLLIPILAYDYG